MFSPEYAEQQLRIINNQNIMTDILNNIKKYKENVLDNTNYPQDQTRLLNIEFPLAGRRTVPTVECIEYMRLLEYYNSTGNLLAIRYIGNDEYYEILLIDPNIKGHIWLIIFSPQLEKIEELREYTFE